MNDTIPLYEDVVDESLIDCSLLSEPESTPQSVNIDLSNGSPIDTNDFIVVHFNIDSILAEGRLEQLNIVCKTMNRIHHTLMHVALRWYLFHIRGTEILA